MNLDVKQFIKSFATVFIITLIIHLFVWRSVPAIGLTKAFFTEMYIFLLALSLAHFFCIRFMFKRWTKYAGLLFTGLGIIKIGFCVLFLLPYLIPLTDNSVPFALNFMISYFILLTFDVVFITKNIKKSINY